MEIRTRILSRTELKEEVSRLVWWFRKRGAEQLLVSYGFDCDCDIDDLYVDRPVNATDLIGFIQSSEAAGIYRLGHNELYIGSDQLNATFTLCHESDLHVESEDEAVIEAVWRAWHEQGYDPYGVTPDDYANT